MAICDGHGLPLAVHLASASPGEVTLVEPTLEDRFLPDFPERLIGDKAYDSDPLDEVLLTKWGIELIARHRDNRRRPPTQDGRALRRRKRRWKIERLFAWFHNLDLIRFGGHLLKGRYDVHDVRNAQTSTCPAAL